MHQWPAHQPAGLALDSSAGDTVAIVDVLAPCEPAFLTAQGLTAGSMQLVDADQSAALYAAMQAGVPILGLPLGDFAEAARGRGMPPPTCSGRTARSTARARFPPAGCPRGSRTRAGR